MSNNRIYATGNEMISLPEIREADGAILSLNFLYMRYKGMISLTGSEETPLFRPFIELNGMRKGLEKLSWSRICHWIPAFESNACGISISGMILTPIGERGFIYELNVRNLDSADMNITVGLEGLWSRAIHEINESKDIDGKKLFYKSGWNGGSHCFDLRNAFSIFSFAPMPEEGMESAAQYQGEDISYSFSKEIALPAGEEKRVCFYFGLGFEEVGAVTSAKEMYRRGFEHEFNTTVKWLKSRMKKASDAHMEQLLNQNLFFNFFFASGKTLDTEELVLVTSRSPRYYVSAAYWDRDSLLWSFPSILLADSAYARKMLDYVFTTQIKNIGIHSRYIDGTVLEPGFELDELCAPILALYNYIKHTGDYYIINFPEYRRGIEHILSVLEEHREESLELYDTFLQPTDDTIVHPYLTYDNILVWRSFRNLAEIYDATGQAVPAMKFASKADKVRKAILGRCVVEYEGRQMFAWSVDAAGNFNIYDEPPGSLLLAAYLEFCDFEDEVYLNTVGKIKDPSYEYSFAGCNIAEIGCAHAPHPWILSLCNSLLCGQKEQVRQILMRTDMDNGIACESINEHTGVCETGAAFATCAGFLAYALHHAFGIDSIGNSGSVCNE
ncbi:MAG: glycoside hydrolase family 125 protein [Clostridia bacterium]